VLGHDPVNAILMTWYRNNTIHALALPSLIACLLVNRRRRIRYDQLLQMIATVYPYLQSELYIGSRSDPAGTLAGLDTDVTHWLNHLCAQGLVQLSDGEVGAPAFESDESYRLALLSQIVMQMLERFLAVRRSPTGRPERWTAAPGTHHTRAAHLAALWTRRPGVLRPVCSITVDTLIARR
jgi:glycerol-3-phosphate O-acyltransferase